MRILLFYILLIAFGCQQTTVNGQQTLSLVPEPVEGTMFGASTSSATSEHQAISHEQDDITSHNLVDSSSCSLVDFYTSQIRLAVLQQLISKISIIEKRGLVLSVFSDNKSQR